MSFGLIEVAALMPLDTSESQHVAQPNNQFNSIHKITLEPSLTGLAPLEVTALEARRKDPQ